MGVTGDAIMLSFDASSAFDSALALDAHLVVSYSGNSSLFGSGSKKLDARPTA